MPSSSFTLYPTIHSEHVFVVLTHILATSNYAHAILAGLPVFEPPANSSTSLTTLHMSTEDEKKTTAGLARAVDLLCQAAGIADWACDHVVPVLNFVKGSNSKRIPWPLETGVEAFRGLSM